MLIVFIFLSLLPLFANGVKDVTLEEIDALIEAKQLNEAVDKLDDFIRYNPSDFDKAQKRMDAILKTRIKYKEIAQELATLQEKLKNSTEENTPENNKRMLDLIGILENLENNQNTQQVSFINSTKSAAQFIYYNNLYEKIMSDGASLYSQKQYEEAAKKYTEGFSLYKDEFYAAGYDSQFLRQVDNRISRVEKNLETFALLGDEITQLFLSFNTALDNDDFETATLYFSQIKSKISILATLRNETADSGMYFKNSFEAIQSDTAKNSTEASFLPFAYRFVLGRESDPRTGILEAYDGFVATLIEDSKEKGMLSLERRFKKLSSLDTVSLPILASFKKDLELCENVNKLYTLFYAQPRGFESIPYEDFTNALSYGELLASTGTEAVGIFNAINDEIKTYDSLIVPSNAVEIFRGENDEYTATVLSFVDMLKRQSENSFLILNDIQLKKDQQNSFSLNLPYVLHNTGFVFEDFYLFMESLLQTIQNRANSSIQSSLQTLSSWNAQACFEIAQNYDDSFSLLNSYINNDLDPSIESHPEIALRDFLQLHDEAGNDIGIFESKLSLFKTMPEDFLSESYSESIANDKKRLEDFVVNANESIKLSRERIATANEYYTSGEDNFSEALVNLDDEYFEEAFESLNFAAEAFEKSLLYRYSIDIEVDTRGRIENLYSKITAKKYEWVVRKVKALKNQSNTLFYEGEFEGAQNLLYEAREIWTTVSAEPEVEVEALIKKVKVAVSMNTETVISPMDPLYPEMSQLLNSVKLDYIAALDAKRDGNTESMLSICSEAIVKLNHVKDVYSHNLEAGLLYTNIKILTDTSYFKNEFKRISKLNFKELSSQQSEDDYNTLKILYEYDASYPGIKTLLNEVEIALGIKDPPPDPKKIYESSQLTREAKNLYDVHRDDIESLERAIEKLNIAKTLNWFNTKADDLKESIQLTLGELRLRDQEKQFQAVALALADGKNSSAKFILNELYKEYPSIENNPRYINLVKQMGGI